MDKNKFADYVIRDMTEEEIEKEDRWHGKKSASEKPYCVTFTILEFICGAVEHTIQIPEWVYAENEQEAVEKAKLQFFDSICVKIKTEQERCFSTKVCRKRGE